MTRIQSPSGLRPLSAEAVQHAADGDAVGAASGSPASVAAKCHSSRPGRISLPWSERRKRRRSSGSFLTKSQLLGGR